jgi:hypothetical protein
MNKEILRHNIEEVIGRPCPPTFSKGVKPNGTSYEDTCIYVRCKIDDAYSIVWVKRNGKDEDFVQDILDRMPTEYSEHLVTIKHDDFLNYTYAPVFDTDTQEMWDKELHRYYKKKGEWCDNYGCD